jgi:soluble lytic murein transglycosylase-like protein
MTITEIKVEIIAAAQRNGANALQALAQAKAESGFDQNAVSPAGAIGIFQIMPATAGELGINPYDALENIDGGTRYIRQVTNWFPGRLDLALAAYNWGVGNVNRMIGGTTSFHPASTWPSTATVLASVPNETRDYINRIIRYMTELVNDPVYLASGGGGELPPGGEPSLDWGSNPADLKLMAALVVGVLLLFALLRR